MSATADNQAHLALTVLVNGEVHIEYHRGRPLAEGQRACLERMDERMSGGVQLGDQWVAQPDSLQRAQFVAIQVIEALRSDNEALIAAGCAYLASRLPELTQIKASLVDGAFSAELVFNQPFVHEVAVDFSPRRLS